MSLSASVCVCAFVWMCVRVCVCVSVRPSVCMSVCMYVCICLSVCLFVCLCYVSVYLLCTDGVDPAAETRLLDDLLAKYNPLAKAYQAGNETLLVKMNIDIIRVIDWVSN